MAVDLRLPKVEVHHYGDRPDESKRGRIQPVMLSQEQAAA